MPIPFSSWLLQGIPECIALAALVFSLGTERLNWRSAVLAGICQAIAIHLIRLMPLSLYIHTIIGVVTLAVFCSKFGKLDIQLSYIYSLVAFFVVILCEALFLTLFDYLHIMTYFQFQTDAKLRTITGMPQVIVVLLLAIWISRRKRDGKLRIFKWKLRLPDTENGPEKRNIANFGEL